MERSQASSKLFWGGVGTQTSKDSSATIFNHQGKVSRKASHELFFGVISTTHHPNQIKLTHPRLIPHHTKKKHIEQLKCHKFVGTTLPKKDRSQASNIFSFGGGWVPMHLETTNNRTYVADQNIPKNYPTHRAIIMKSYKMIWNDISSRWFVFHCVTCQLRGKSEIQNTWKYSKIITHHVQITSNYLKDRGPPRDNKCKGPTLTEIRQNDLYDQTCRLSFWVGGGCQA